MVPGITFFLILEKKTMAKKGSMPDFRTIDEYIASQPEVAQEKLQELRNIIREAVPETQEVLNYKVPTFILVLGRGNKKQIMMAGYARYVSFYPFPATTAAFADELKGYKQGKGSVQFPFDKPLPKDLITRMVKHRRDEILGSESQAKG
jgi:uncharacterized protein YdhG (YjbR/CyaY superfamily)